MKKNKTNDWRKKIIKDMVNSSIPDEQFFDVIKRLENAVKPKRGRPKKETFEWKEN